MASNYSCFMDSLYTMVGFTLFYKLINVTFITPTGQVGPGVGSWPSNLTNAVYVSQ